MLYRFVSYQGNKSIKCFLFFLVRVFVSSKKIIHPVWQDKSTPLKKKKVSFFAVYSKPVTVYSILYTFSNFTLAITL